MVGVGGGGVALLLLGDGDGGHEGGHSEGGPFRRRGLPPRSRRSPPRRLRRLPPTPLPLRSPRLALHLPLRPRRRRLLPGLPHPRPPEDLRRFGQRDNRLATVDGGGTGGVAVWGVHWCCRICRPCARCPRTFASRDENYKIVGSLDGCDLDLHNVLLGDTNEVPALNFDESNFSLWGSGEWWMLLAAQSMAVGTVMVRWVSKYSDPVMATGWHMVLGGLPLLAISILNHDNGVSGNLGDFTTNDLLALLYTSIFGSAISYGVYFYSATKGSLTRLSSLTFLTPMFASVFGFLYFGETFSPLQLTGTIITVIGIYMVNYRSTVE
ncbi:hypothetical protein TIFTF001_001995 [Ficus carica]|uniref:EamA domain-containing protein n=1 Tax=Ficus carica TaxID=3494 RepID=A0AA88CRE2_FICCA|nr:hypothetical protein TIFTF001_001995 [Ficus carica]